MQQTTTQSRTLSPEDLDQRRRRRHEARASATYREFLTLASTELELPEPQSERVILTVLTALEQRLPFDEMADLASQLPYKLREILATCEEPGEASSPRDIGEAEFLGMVARDLGVGPEEAEQHVRAVFRVLAQTVSRGEIEQVIHLLPRRLRRLWPSLNPC